MTEHENDTAPDTAVTAALTQLAERLPDAPPPTIAALRARHDRRQRLRVVVTGTGVAASLVLAGGLVWAFAPSKSGGPKTVAAAPPPSVTADPTPTTAPAGPPSRQAKATGDPASDPYAVTGGTTGLTLSPFSPTDLVGMWTVTGPDVTPGTVLRLGDDAALFQPCGFLLGDWIDGRDGALLLSFSSYSSGCTDPGPAVPDWLLSISSGQAQTSGDGFDVLDRAGTVVAHLAPGGHPTLTPDISSDYAKPPTVTPALEKRLNPEIPPFPADVTAGETDTLVGSWLPQGAAAKSPEPPLLTINEDGTYQGSDGCNGFGGRWAISGGILVATSGPSTLIGCAGSDVPGRFSSAAIAGIDGNGALVLIGSDGKVIGKLDPQS